MIKAVATGARMLSERRPESRDIPKLRRTLTFPKAIALSTTTDVSHDTAATPPVPAPAARKDFIREMVAEDVATGRFGRAVQTRFPPEPNGFLHVGHAKSICLNFGLAEEFAGRCNLRFDDTNPSTEDIAYVESIKEDVRWLGFDWDGEYYASDYFGKLYEFAELLVNKDQFCIEHKPANDSLVVGKDNSLVNVVVFLRAPLGKKVDIHPDYEAKL